MIPLKIMILIIKPLNDNVREFYTNHTSYHEGDAGIDLFIPEDVVVKAHSTSYVNLNIACEAVNNDGKNLSYYMYPRSSLSKTPLRLANSVGIIDAGYRGPIICALDNISDTEYELNRGTRLVQICGPVLQIIKIKIREELSSSARGTNGYGSTGQ